MATSIGVTEKDFRNGAILATIAHAVWIARDPTLAVAQGWDGRNYLLNDHAGTIGTVTFGEDGLVGVFFDAKSPRSPFVSGKPYSIDPLVAGMPPALRKLAEEEALQYMIQEHEGADVPIITAAVWSERGEVVAAEPWDEVRENGGHVVRFQCMDADGALAEWGSDMSLSPEQLALARTLYERKLALGDARYTMSEEEKRILGATAGEAEARERLAAVGIDF